MVEVSARAPTGNGLLGLIAFASGVVFLAGCFSCGRSRGWGNGWGDDDNNGRGNGFYVNNGNNNNGCFGNVAYTLACGLVGMVVALFMIFGEKCSPVAGCVSSARPYVGLFLFLWWLIGACIITFDGPYTVVSNGYLGAWVACFASIAYSMEVSEWANKFINLFKGEASKMGTAMLGLVIASCVELIAAAIACGNCSNYVAYAVAVGAVSLFFCIVILFVPQCIPAASSAAPYIMVFLFLWWFVAAIVLTFVSPFVWAGNGYFATWVAAICAAIMFLQSGMAPGAAHSAADSGPKVKTSGV